MYVRFTSADSVGRMELPYHSYAVVAKSSDHEWQSRSNVRHRGPDCRTFLCPICCVPFGLPQGAWLRKET